VARRATVIKDGRRDAGNLLVLDAGNSLLGETGSASEPAPRTQGQSSVEILNRLGYDAVALGEFDLALPKEELLKRLAEVKGFSFLSANLRDEATGELLAEPYVVKEVGGHRVALIGITGTSRPDHPGFRIDPTLEAARQYVQEAAAKADVIILLSNAGVNADKAIAGEVPGIDLIISSGLQALEEPLQVGEGTLIVRADTSSAGHAGRIIGSLEAEFDASGAMTGHTWKKITLDPAIADDADMAAWVESVTKVETPAP
jgi:2',3'-cyclic-nucleotide 2'-phosphodiesterase (5'-nucleotidase family)